MDFYATFSQCADACIATQELDPPVEDLGDEGNTNSESVKISLEDDLADTEDSPDSKDDSSHTDTLSLREKRVRLYRRDA